MAVILKKYVIKLGNNKILSVITDLKTLECMVSTLTCEYVFLWWKPLLLLRELIFE